MLIEDNKLNLLLIHTDFLSVQNFIEYYRKAQEIKTTDKG